MHRVSDRSASSGSATEADHDGSARSLTALITVMLVNLVVGLVVAAATWLGHVGHTVIGAFSLTHNVVDRIGVAALGTIVLAIAAGTRARQRVGSASTTGVPVRPDTSADGRRPWPSAPDRGRPNNGWLDSTGVPDRYDDATLPSQWSGST